MSENNNVLKTLRSLQREKALLHIHILIHTYAYRHTQSASLNSNPSSNNYPNGHMENFGKH